MKRRSPFFQLVTFSKAILHPAQPLKSFPDDSKNICWS